jgi:hypothetical protein
MNFIFVAKTHRRQVKPIIQIFHSPNLQVWDCGNSQRNDGRAFTPLLPVKCFF